MSPGVVVRTTTRMSLIYYANDTLVTAAHTLDLMNNDSLSKMMGPMLKSDRNWPAMVSYQSQLSNYKKTAKGSVNLVRMKKSFSTEGQGI